jgi:membrane protein DedA with SNARE-associated domain
VFWWVLAEQSALALPSSPLLLTAGALIRRGRLHLTPALACCVGAALIADTV